MVIQILTQWNSSTNFSCIKLHEDYQMTFWIKSFICVHSHLPSQLQQKSYSNKNNIFHLATNNQVCVIGLFQVNSNILDQIKEKALLVYTLLQLYKRPAYTVLLCSKNMLEFSLKQLHQ